MNFLRQEALTFESSVVEPWIEWDEATTYQVEEAPGDVATVDDLTNLSVVRYGNYFYRTIMDDNVGFVPTDHLGTRWIKWQVSNTHAMFDLRATTKSVSELGDNIVVEFAKGLKDTLAVGYYTAESVRVDNIDGAVSEYPGAVGDYVMDFAGNYKMVTGIGTTTTTSSFDFDTWSSLVTYMKDEVNQAGTVSNSIVRQNGLVYKTKLDTNLNQSPALDDGTYWEQLCINHQVTPWSVTTNYALTPAQSDALTTLTLVSHNGIYYRSLVNSNLGNTPTGVTTVEWEVVSIVSHAEAKDLTYGFILNTQIIENSVNAEVIDYYSYIYEPYVISSDKSKLFYLLHTGSTVRVTLYRETSLDYAECGYLVASEATGMGDTLYGVDFSFTSYSEKTTDKFGALTITKRGIQELIDFETSIDSASLMYTKRKIKDIYDDIVLFVLDESADSVHENIMTLGTIANVSTVLSNPVNTTIAWSIYETI